MKKLLSTPILLLVILLLAAFLRLWQLGAVPGGVHGDELSYGYNAFSILLTGKDEHGVAFPLVLQSWGDYKPALYAYLTIPWIALFDLTPFAIRITAALFGIGSVLLLYFVTKKLVNNQSVALLAAFFLAISPWHITFSRTVSEVVVSLFFLLLLILSLLNVQKFNWKWFVMALVSGVLSLGSYTAARFFVVIITILFTILWTKRVDKKISLPVPVALLGVIFIGLGFFISAIDGTSRFQQISVFSSPETQLILEEQIREEGTNSPLLTRILHNKVVNYSRSILTNYNQYFTIDYLFLNGGQPKRMIIPDQGLFYLWQLPFLLAGIYVLLRKKTRAGFFLLSWWFILLLPASLTTDEIPNVYRSLVTIFPLIILIAIGLHELFSYHRLSRLKIPIILLIGFVGIWEFAYYQNQYYVHQEVHQPWYRDYAYKPLMEEVEKIAPNYKQIIITKAHVGADLGVLFWSKYDPATYQAEGAPGEADYKGFGKYLFDPRDCPLTTDDKNVVQGKPGILYIASGTCVLPDHNVRLLKTIRWQDNTAAFQLLEYIPSSTEKELFPSR